MESIGGKSYKHLSWIRRNRRATTVTIKITIELKHLDLSSEYADPQQQQQQRTFDGKHRRYITSTLNTPTCNSNTYSMESIGGNAQNYDSIFTSALQVNHTKWTNSVHGVNLDYWIYSQRLYRQQLFEFFFKRRVETAGRINTMTELTSITAIFCNPSTTK